MFPGLTPRARNMPPLRGSNTTRAAKSKNPVWSKRSPAPCVLKQSPNCQNRGQTLRSVIEPRRGGRYIARGVSPGKGDQPKFPSPGRGDRQIDGLAMNDPPAPHRTVAGIPDSRRRFPISEKKAGSQPPLVVERKSRQSLTISFGFSTTTAWPAPSMSSN